MADVQNSQMEGDQISFVQPDLIKPKHSPLIVYGYKMDINFIFRSGKTNGRI